MNLSFQKTKPPLENLLLHLVETFNKPLHGHTQNNIILSMLIGLAKDFKKYKALVKSDLTEEELRAVSMYSVIVPTATHIKLQAYIPNPHDLPLWLVLSLYDIVQVDTYEKIVDVQASSTELTCLSGSPKSPLEIIKTKYNIFNNLVGFFPEPRIEKLVEVSTKQDLYDLVLVYALQESKSLPTFVYKTPQIAVSDNEEDGIITSYDLGTEETSYEPHYICVDSSKPYNIGVVSQSSMSHAEGDTEVMLTEKQYRDIFTYSSNDGHQPPEVPGRNVDIIIRNTNGELEYTYDVKASSFGWNLDNVAPIIRYRVAEPVELSDYRPRSIRVSGERARIGYIDWTENVQGDDNFIKLTEEQYDFASRSETNDSDKLKSSECTALTYDTSTTKIDIEKLAVPVFSMKPTRIILRYKDKNETL